MKFFFLACALSILFYSHAQTSIVLKKQRLPQVDVSNYKQIVIGDVVGPLGSKTEESLDLTDALTAKLFNAKTLEVIDRNALDNIFGAQHLKDLQTMDEQTKQTLNKKLSNALLITGRMQSAKLEQKLIYNDQGIVINGCTRTYYYQVKGDMTVQLKIWYVKTGRMLYSDAVTKPVNKQTKEDCKIPEKLDLAEITRTTVRDLSEEVAKLVVPFDVSTVLQFKDPGLFKSPFKQLREAVSYLQINNADAGLAILKNYTESKDIKDKNKNDAWYNYGLALVYTGKYTEAKTALQTAASLNGSNVAAVSALMKMMDDEEQIARKMEAQQKQQQEDNVNAVAAPVNHDKTQSKGKAKPSLKKA